jgi:hypothetical protein
VYVLVCDDTSTRYKGWLNGDKNYGASLFGDILRTFGASFLAKFIWRFIYILTFGDI